jgi:hypothetical protein
MGETRAGCEVLTSRRKKKRENRNWKIESVAPTALAFGRVFPALAR